MSILILIVHKCKIINYINFINAYDITSIASKCFEHFINFDICNSLETTEVNTIIAFLAL